MDVVSNPTPDPSERRFMTPATRTALIISGLLLGLILMSTLWVSREAMRIRRLRNATAVRNSDASGGMVWIAAGKFTMGANDGQPDEQPLHDVKVGGFWMDRTEVTNEQFGRFVDATGYVTVAERPVEGSGAAVGGYTFSAPERVENFSDVMQWWKLTPGASWRHPEGPRSDLDGRGKHPVVQVAWEDACAYAKWAGKRLPTEAEWEFAARGGLIHVPYVWGREKLPEGRWMANLWQGRFPQQDVGEDGFKGLAPVASFLANGFGLHDMAGNVWEWCADYYGADYYSHSARENPPGPSSGTERVVRGGSFLCNDVYSKGYRTGSRMRQQAGAAFAHLGFRCVRDGQAP